MNLHLGTNNLLSPISSKMGKLKNLVSLDLSSNMLTGPLFHTLTNLRSLVKLYLGGNFFIGTIPTEICNIKSLMTLHLGENNLFGSPHINIGSTSTKNVTKWTKIILPIVIVISFIFLLLAIVLLSRQKIIGNTRSECKAKRNGFIYSEHGIMTEVLHLKTSLQQKRTLTSNIALKPVVMVVFTKQCYQVEK